MTQHNQTQSYLEKDPDAQIDFQQAQYMTQHSQKKNLHRIQEHKKVVKRVTQGKSLNHSTLTSQAKASLKNMREQYQGDKFTRKQDKMQMLMLQSMSDGKRQPESLQTLENTHSTELIRMKELQEKIKAGAAEFDPNLIPSKCTRCRKLLPIREAPVRKKRAIDASPLKKRGKRPYSASKTLEDIRTIDFSEGRHSVHHSRERLKSRGNLKSNRHLTPLKNRNKSPHSTKKKRFARNLLQFLDNNKSKSRLELAKAYNIT
jgi:hypothetical protein